MKSFISKLLSKISSIFQDGIDSNWSSNRVAFIYTVLISNVCFWGCWTGLTLSKMQLQEIPDSVIWIYCIANGIVSGAHLVQKTLEKKNAI